MAELTVDMTYADALFQAARDVDKVETIMEEGDSVLSILQKEREFLLFFNNPTIPAADKKESLRRIFEGRICKEHLNFLYVLVDKSRTRNYPGIMTQYKNTIADAEGYARGTVFSVTPLSDGRKNKLEEETGRLLKRNVKLENKIDKSLIGGVKILIDGKLLDASLKKRLDDLKETLF